MLLFIKAKAMAKRTADAPRSTNEIFSMLSLTSATKSRSYKTSLTYSSSIICALSASKSPAATTLACRLMSIVLLNGLYPRKSTKSSPKAASRLSAAASFVTNCALFAYGANCCVFNNVFKSASGMDSSKTKVKVKFSRTALDKSLALNTKVPKRPKTNRTRVMDTTTLR